MLTIFCQVLSPDSDQLNYLSGVVWKIPEWKYWVFTTKMLYLDYISLWRYTILIGNPRNVNQWQNVLQFRNSTATIICAFTSFWRSAKAFAARAKNMRTGPLFPWSWQSLEFIMEMRTLMEMKIKNHGKCIFCGKKIDKHTFLRKLRCGSVHANWRYKTDIRHEF